MPRSFLASLLGLSLVFASLPLVSVMFFRDGSASPGGEAVTTAIVTDTSTAASSDPVAYGVQEDGHRHCGLDGGASPES